MAGLGIPENQIATVIAEMTLRKPIFSGGAARYRST